MLSVEEQERINEIVNLFRHSKKTSCIILVDCVNQSLRDEIEEEIRRRLREEGFVFKKVKITSNSNKNLPYILKQSTPKANKIFFIYDFKKTLPKDFLEIKEWPESLQHLNYNREDFVKYKISVLFWLDKPTLQAIAKRAPDFWTFRNLVVEFVESKLKIDRLRRERSLPTIYTYSDKKEAKHKLEVTQKILQTLLKRKHRDYQVITRLCGDLGTIYYFLSDFKRSLKYFEKTLFYASKSGEKGDIARAIGDIGLIHDVRGNSNLALTKYKKALSIFEKIGDLQGEAWSLDLISGIFVDKGDLRTALKYASRSLEIGKKLPNPAYKSMALSSIGFIMFRKRELDEAMCYFKDALVIDRKQGYHGGVAQCMRLIGDVYREKGNLEQSKKYYKRSLQKAQKIGDLAVIADANESFGRYYLEKYDFDKALDYFLQVLRVKKLLGNQLYYANNLALVAYLYEEKGLMKKSLTYLKQALTIFKKVGAKQDVNTMKYEIKTLNQEMRRFAES